MEISEIARDLQAQTGPDGSSALAPERLREVLTRLTSGFYDRPEVLDVVVRGVAGDLGADVKQG